MTREQIEALKALAEAATNGPWTHDDLDRRNVISVHPDEYTASLGTYSNVSICGREPDASHIAAWSPTNVLKFLAAYEAMEAENKALREVASAAKNAWAGVGWPGFREEAAGKERCGLGYESGGWHQPVKPDFVCTQWRDQAHD